MAGKPRPFLQPLEIPLQPYFGVCEAADFLGKLCYFRMSVVGRWARAATFEDSVLRDINLTAKPRQ